MIETLRILLVDDNPEFLESAARFLSATPFINIVGCACSGEEALDIIAHIQPDLLLVDISMPGMNGLETTQQIKDLPDPPRVIVMTLLDDPEYRAAASDAGADSFIAKSAFSTAVLPLIESLFAHVE